MRVLVTGGAGFIGSRLVRRLAERGDEVTVLDLDEPDDDVDAVGASVLDLDAVRTAVKGHDAVAHLAGFVRAGVREDPYLGATLQIQGTLNVLQACADHDVPHVAYASSFYVYDGIPAPESVDEETPLDPTRMELFGSAKYMGELLCKEWARETGVGTSIFRIGPAYGGAGSSAVDEFVDTGLRGDTIEVWGRGDRRNQYTYVGDIAEAIAAGLTDAGETYNLVAPEPVSLRRMAEILAEQLGFETTFDESKPEGPSFPTISAAKAIERLGWEPTALADGVQLLVGAQRAGARSHG